MRVSSRINAVHGGARPCREECCTWKPQSTYRGRGELWGVYLPSQLKCTKQTLYMMLDRVKGGWACIPPPLPAWADFSIVMECTPESGHCHSVCTLCSKLFPAQINDVQYMTNYLLLKEKLYMTTTFCGKERCTLRTARMMDADVGVAGRHNASLRLLFLVERNAVHIVLFLVGRNVLHVSSGEKCLYSTV
jgi:hypothetical protein